MTFVVIYDANVLFGNILRDLLIRVSQEGLVHARCTPEIVEEAFRNLALKRPDIAADKLERTRHLMCEALRDGMVSGYEPLIQAVDLPDPGDRHVLAAAIRAGASVIVTWNLKDFPASSLEQWDVEAKSPDDFMIDQLHLDAAAVHRIIQQQADGLKRPPMTVGDVIESLERSGLVQTAAMLRSGLIR